MPTVDFFGEQFELSDSPSEFALMEFAEAASEGQDGDTMAGMASMLRLILECIAEPKPVAVIDSDGAESSTTAPSERARFRAVARKNRAGAKDLLPLIKATFEQVTDRPTGRPADSSDGPGSTPERSAPNAEGRVSALLPGRPDLQLAVLHAVAS